jgi:hypothetical protein
MRALLVIVALFAAALLVEGAARLAGYRPDVPLVEPNNYFGWRLIPNNTWWYEGRVPVRSNSRGLRDREFEYAKPSGVTRVLLLGDSMAEGAQVPGEAVFAKGLEQSLNRARGPLELINAGIGGFGTTHAVLFYEREGVKYQAEVVVLAFFMGNDVWDNGQRVLPMGTPGKPPAPYFVLADGELRLENYPCRCESLQQPHGFARVRQAIRRRSGAYVAVAPAIIKIAPGAAAWLGRAGVMGTLSHQPSWLMPDDIPLLFYNFAEVDSPEWEEAWEVTRRLLRRLQEDVSKAGAKFLVVGIPTREQVHPEMWDLARSRYPNLQKRQWDLEKPDRLLAAAVSAAGATYVSLLQALRNEARKSGALLYFDRMDEAHLNERGHAAIAAALHDTVAAFAPQPRREW